MKKILIRMRSGIVYSSDDYIIGADIRDYVGESPLGYKKVEISLYEHRYILSYFHTKGTTFFIENKDQIISFLGKNIESITIFK